MFPTNSVVLSLRDNDHCKRLRDPGNPHLHHLETLIPFSEAAKLDKGNANLRPPVEKKPLRDMLDTVEESPETFHLKNRGITYLCQRFEFDNSKRHLTVTTPRIPEDLDDDDIETRFGIADGGHSFEVVRRTVKRLAELREIEDWTEPFVRVHFIGSDRSEIQDVERLVEALNTSLQVQEQTIDEFKKEFVDLKNALKKAGFDTDLIAFKENESEKYWDIREILRCLACFLKDRWQYTHPKDMYKSRHKALALFKDPGRRSEFQRLYDVVLDIITLPEFIQAELGSGKILQGRKFGKSKLVKPLKKPLTIPGTTLRKQHKMDLAAVLPMAAAFRELLALRGDRYYWRLDPKRVFRHCGSDLYSLFLSKSGKVRAGSQLAADSDYWGQCANIVLRAKDEILNS